MLLAGVGCILMLPRAAYPAEGEKTSQAPEKVKVAIVVGGHGYDQKAFDKLGSSYDDVAEVWDGGPYTVFDDTSKFKYDVILTYNLSSAITDTPKRNVLKLLEKGVGLAVWHHALARNSS